MASSSDENEVDVEGSEEPDSPVGLDKRAHHNLLERKRRDHIKDSFSVLRDSIPSLQGEKASRAQILNKATEFIKHMRQKNAAHASDLDRIRKDNEDLERQIRALEEEGGLSPMPLQLPGSQGGVNFLPARGAPSSRMAVFDSGGAGASGLLPTSTKRSTQGEPDEDVEGDKDGEGQLSPAKRLRSVSTRPVRKP